MLTTILGTVSAATPAMAQDAARIDAIQQQINALQNELRQMKSALARRDGEVKAAQQQAAQARADARQAQTNATEAKTQSAAAQTTAKAAAALPSVQAAEIKPAEATLSMPKGRPTFTSADGKYSVSVGLQFNFDFGGYFTGNTPNPNNRSATLAPFGENLRRLRIPFLFRYEDITAAVTPEFGGTPDGTVTLYEANLNYTGIKPLTFTAGYFKPWLTLGDSTSSQDFLFLERPSIVEIARNVAAGDTRASAGVRGFGEQWFAAAYLTGQKYGAQTATTSIYSQDGGTLRLAGRPLTSEDYDLHLGVSASDAFHLTRNAGGGQTTSLSDYPEARVDPVKLINTGTIAGANSAYTAGPEFGFRYKNFLVEGEYIQVGVQRSGLGSAPAPNLSFSGGYGQVSWVLTGEPRKYDPSAGAFSRPVPAEPFSPKDGKWGAFELAARYSATDLNSHSSSGVSQAATGGVFGGYQQIFSFGLNWYLNNNYRVMADYYISQVDKLSTSGTTQTGQNFQALLFRLQATY
jgi:phosphate-selective porin OprO/OprP